MELNSNHILTDHIIFLVLKKQLISKDQLELISSWLLMNAHHIHVKKYMLEKSMELTHKWLERCIDRFNSSKNKYSHNQVLFPIVQGSMFKDLRKISADYITSMDLPGNAIGGLSVGEPHDIMYEISESVLEILPANKPRYLMVLVHPLI